MCFIVSTIFINSYLNMRNRLQWCCEIAAWCDWKNPDTAPVFEQHVLWNSWHTAWPKGHHTMWVSPRSGFYEAGVKGGSTFWPSSAHFQSVHASLKRKAAVVPYRAEVPGRWVNRDLIVICMCKISFWSLLSPHILPSILSKSKIRVFALCLDRSLATSLGKNTPCCVFHRLPKIT